MGALVGTTTPAERAEEPESPPIVALGHQGAEAGVGQRAGPGRFSRASEITARLPDGRWVAFQSDRTGRWEIYVRPFPNASDGEWMVSASGGFSPRWARSGGEIFYFDEAGTMWSVEVVRGGPFTTAARQPLFDASAYELDFHQEYDVTLDGRFLMVRDRSVLEGAERELVWVEHWPEELRAMIKR